MTNSAGVVTGIRNTRIFLVSLDSYSGTLAYERGRLSARASYIWVHNFGNWIIGRNLSFSTRFSF